MIAIESTNPPIAEPQAFGSTKREVLLILKREGQADLQTLAERLHISKMAVHKHIQELEQHGLVQRTSVRGTKGRPRLALQLAPEATNLFPKAYAAVTCAALAYIEEKLGRKAVEEALRRRQTETLSMYRDQVNAGTLAGRVHQLATLRDREGYMAEDKRAGQSNFEILEHNCPIIAIAENYWEACNVENEMFQKVLGANVETTHRVVAGANVCRFLISPRRR
ncbi:transcriptional regulator [Candidatus Bathyarchaeota archaeon]|nr:MAG: transcriptional regulator [Candidatus Bathyarchaeota archaeon]TMI30755.1 MAG: transcriptional regulator [Candidatus Bathyarchaeota archaeon]